MAHASCPGPMSRRALLRLGSLALGGLALPQLLAARASQSPRPTSVILFWMWGGPSQFETLDPKPDAPVEYRGPFRPIRTTVPGMDVCELFPRLAQQGRRLALVRSLHHGMSSHNDGSIEVLTGKTPTVADPTSTARSEHPDFGMIASRLRGLRPDGLPQYVGIPTQPFMTRPGYLGLNHQAFVTGDPSAANFSPPHLGLTGGVTVEQFASRRQLLTNFDRLRRDLDVHGRLEGSDRLREAAFQLLSNPQVAQAFALGREDARLRDRYGRHLWGQSCLLARRLAEAGAGVITIDALAPEKNQRIYFSWDDHADAQPGWDLAEGMRWRAPFMDQALSALIEDVYERGGHRRPLLAVRRQLGWIGKTCRIDARQGDAGSLADPGVAVAPRNLERGDGVLGLFAKRAKPEGSAAADIALLVLEGFDQRRDDLCCVPLALRQEANRHGPLALLRRLQIFEQLGGRFRLAAAGARQQAKQRNKIGTHAHAQRPRSKRLTSPNRKRGSLQISLALRAGEIAWITNRPPLHRRRWWRGIDKCMGRCWW